ncbi:hypothetical protein PV327_011108 [Microctonus hyperodae]|uniref:Uncharacterized protein n=1 Tax=Microctonus hyperodae TaxID=165561 RepID=A0AA39FRN8_MICHY|nr:hypothetical protein PV327_011108 [Microctonus hyperodae]
MDPINKMSYSADDKNHDDGLLKIQDDASQVSTQESPEKNESEKPLQYNIEKILIDDDNEYYMPLSIHEMFAKCRMLKQIQYKCRDAERFEIFLRYLPTEKLEDFSIYSNPRNVGDEFDTYKTRTLSALLRNALARAPNLHSLKINYLPLSELAHPGGKATLKSLSIETKSLPRLTFRMKHVENLETLCIICEKINNVEKIWDIVKFCKKIHSIHFETKDTLPDATICAMMLLPNLRRLHLKTREKSYDLYLPSRNEIDITQKESLLSPKDQIITHVL